MWTLATYFNDFLKEIRLTTNQQNDLITGHTTLSDRLKKDEDLKDIIVSMFLQGSYKRSTAVRPKNNNKSDVDLVVVTNLNKDEKTPQDAIDLFTPFMDKYYKDKYRIQTKSIGIELSYVDLDVVITSAPSEVEKELIENSFMQSTDELIDIDDSDTTDWKSEPLYILNTKTEEWEETDPIAQIKWTIEKNKNCNGHYVNVVKSLKWWKKHTDKDNNAPKSYPLEHFIGYCCPDGIESVAEGIVYSLENIVANHSTKPVLDDHGVPTHDVFERITEDEYSEFYELVKDAAATARKALDASNKSTAIEEWKKLFGSKFPDDKTSNSSANMSFTERSSVSEIKPERYA
ncbi:SMODS domain-containing nucleotidyltransferase [Clostridium saccharoperbutylacetonicum]|uniref:SMODS domain-containing nucleotidyltransferase n=1 Tax=Clostridium saccharoperbutylacetonicum TaxID=36745 RepID=UPI000983E089|nr:nucleotidyltransferase [Clostridium saccharoperbutylacetonicum]AQR93106.1 hypothetical protein CLSAP_03810 [Clostridium saccharoperbutylacetonicum]NSB34516.1 putative nucleotidyltransferase [Clostridium saccharoperbutylacetonicum]